MIEIVEIEKLYELETGHPLWLYCRGHITAEQFIEGVKAHAEYEIEDFELYDIRPESIQRAYARNVPVPPHSEFAFEAKYTVNLCKQGRGAYPITYFEIEQ